MGLMRVVLGGEIDVVTPGELSESEKRIVDAVSGNKPKDSRFLLRPCFGSGVVTAAGMTVIDLNPVGPAVGRIWNITRMTALVDDHTSQAGMTVAWYKGDDANISLSQCFYPGQAIPSSVYLSKDIEWQTFDERLFAVVYGGVAGTNVVLTAMVRDYKQSDIIQQRL